MGASFNPSLLIISINSYKCLYIQQIFNSTLSARPCGESVMCVIEWLNPYYTELLSWPIGIAPDNRKSISKKVSHDLQQNERAEQSNEYSYNAFMDAACILLTLLFGTDMNWAPPENGDNRPYNRSWSLSIPWILCSCKIPFLRSSRKKII